MSSSADVGVTARRLRSLIAEVCPIDSIGADAVHIPTWSRHLKIGGDALMQRVYTVNEIDFCSGRVERLAARLAAKEAALKALGTGIRGIALRDVEIHSELSGRPTIVLHGPAQRRAERLGLIELAVSLCHEGELALAVVVGKGACLR